MLLQGCGTGRGTGYLNATGQRTTIYGCMPLLKIRIVNLGLVLSACMPRLVGLVGAGLRRHG